jgi:aspartokinase
MKHRYASHQGHYRIRNLSIVTVQGRGMQGVPGVAGRVFSAVARSGASVLMITQSSSEQSICFVVRTAEAKSVVAMVEREIELEIMRGELERVVKQDEVAIIAVVGVGMRGRQVSPDACSAPWPKATLTLSLLPRGRRKITSRSWLLTAM